MLNKVKEGGFNCVRWCTCDNQVLTNPNIYSVSQDQNSDLYGQTYNDILKIVVDYGGSIGLKFIIESHNNEGGNSPNWGAQQMNGQWYDVGGTTNGQDGGGQQGNISDDTFLNVWKTRATIFAGNSAVIGYDIKNEPLAYGNMCTWGDGGTNDIRAMYQRVGNAIHEIDANPLIICEGPQNYGGSFNGQTTAPFGDLTGVQQNPVNLDTPNKVVYSVHVYPNSVSGSQDPDNGDGAAQHYSAVWGYLITQNIAPVWIGEMADDMQRQDDTDYMQTLISYLNGGQGSNGGPTFSGNQQGVSWSWWAISPVAGYNGDSPGFGIFADWDLSGMDQTQQQFWNQILPFTTSVPSSTTSSPSSSSSSSSTSGAPAQNTDSMWWGKTSPSDSWSPEDGTDTSSLPTTPATDAPTEAPTQAPATQAPTLPMGSIVMAGSGNSILDASGNVWEISDDGKVVVNGQTEENTGNVVELANVSGILWQENVDEKWWGKTSPDADWLPNTEQAILLSVDLLTQLALHPQLPELPLLPLDLLAV